MTAADHGRRIRGMWIGHWVLTPGFLAVIVIVVVLLALLSGTRSGDGGWWFAGLVVSLVASVPLHELGHVVAVRGCGFRIHHVRLGLYSGVAWGADEDLVTVRQLVAISAAGPAVNAAVAVVAALLAARTDGAVATAWLGVAVGMTVAAVIDLVPVSRPGAGDVPRMSDGAIIRAALREG